MTHDDSPDTPTTDIELSALYGIADEPYLVLLLDQMTSAERAWCAQTLSERLESPLHILAALRAREDLTRIPCYSHHPWSDLQGWVNLVTSHPVAYGLASPD